MDPITISALIGGGSALAAGGLNFIGQHRANQANKAMSSKQMQFQQTMSSTAYQRAMQDMALAGLNPILAAGGGGASTPQGAAIQQQNELGGAASSAVDAARMYAELRNLNEQNKLLKAQTFKANAEGMTAHTEAKLKTFQLPAARTEAEIDSGKQGRILRYINRYLPAINSALDVFKSVSPIPLKGK